jgi:hypothetical protein
MTGSGKAILPVHVVQMQLHLNGGTFITLMEAVHTSETSIYFYKTTRCYIPETVIIRVVIVMTTLMLFQFIKQLTYLSIFKLYSTQSAHACNF